MDAGQMNDEGVRCLCMAIVIRAAEDYMNGARVNFSPYRVQAERFFRSQWFEMVSDFDGEAILRELDQRIKETQDAQIKAGRKAYKLETNYRRCDGRKRNDN